MAFAAAWDAVRLGLKAAEEPAVHQALAERSRPAGSRWRAFSLEKPRAEIEAVG
jgi:hypothetical protein